MWARRLETLVSLFIARNNLPISLSNDLMMFLKHIDINRKVQKQLSCGATKCAAIICNITDKYIFDKLVSVLQKQKFSLIVDESTDVSSYKNLARSVRFRCKDYSVIDQFLVLLEIYDASSSRLYTAIQAFFLKHDIPYVKNMVGFAADEASVMFGEHDSLVTKLKKDVPHLFVIKFIRISLFVTGSFKCNEGYVVKFKYLID